MWGPDTAGFQQLPDSASLAHSLRAVYTYSTPTISYLAPSMFMEIDGETVETVTLFWGAPKSLQMVTIAMKLKDTSSLEEKL